jgi:uncharacterized protein with GYD domain
MATYILLTRLAPDAIKQPTMINDFARRVSERLKANCPEVKWIASYAVLGPYDYADIFEAPDNEAATKVALIIRSFGHATTEIWPATPWDRFRELVQGISA